jgi:hypothetical protein
LFLGSLKWKSEVLLLLLVFSIQRLSCSYTLALSKNIKLKYALTSAAVLYGHGTGLGIEHRMFYNRKLHKLFTAKSQKVWKGGK